MFFYVLGAFHPSFLRSPAVCVARIYESNRRRSVKWEADKEPEKNKNLLGSSGTGSQEPTFKSEEIFVCPPSLTEISKV